MVPSDPSALSSGRTHFTRRPVTSRGWSRVETQLSERLLVLEPRAVASRLEAVTCVSPLWLGPARSGDVDLEPL